MDEWVIVDYPVVRPVNVDHMANGVTQALIQVETGKHTFDLGMPVNYKPAFRTVPVSGTSPMRPMQLQFTPSSSEDQT